MRALVAVVQPLLGVATALVGLGALAYLIGWRETQSYYSSLGAPWIASLLSPQRLMQASAWVFWITLTFAFTSVYSLSYDGVTHRGMRWWAIVTLVLGLSFWALDFLPLGYFAETSKAVFLGIGALCFAVSAGLTLAEVVARFKEDGFRWHSYYMWLLFFAGVLAFSWAPTRMGESRARLVIHSGGSALPKVELASDESKRAWHLLEVTDNSAILFSFGPKPSQSSFRVAAFADLKSVTSSLRE